MALNESNSVLYRMVNRPYDSGLECMLRELRKINAPDTSLVSANGHVVGTRDVFAMFSLDFRRWFDSSVDPFAGTYLLHGKYMSLSKQVLQSIVDMFYETMVRVPYHLMDEFERGLKLMDVACEVVKDEEPQLLVTTYKTMMPPQPVMKQAVKRTAQQASLTGQHPLEQGPLSAGSSGNVNQSAARRKCDYIDIADIRKDTDGKSKLFVDGHKFVRNGKGGKMGMYWDCERKHECGCKSGKITKKINDVNMVSDTTASEEHNHE